MRVVPVPCLSDNYAYLVIDEASGRAGVVDPSEAEPVARAVAAEGVELVAILNTHHHHDHVGGNADLLSRHPGLRVYGHASDARRVPGLTDGVNAGDAFEVAGLRFSVLHNPGHTTGAVTYVADGCAFTGDTLFAAGCGRVFEGTPAMMYRSLNEVIGDLPADTRVYFGHEYTEKNLQFARSVEPDNDEVTRRLDEVSAARRAGRFTTPTTMALERRTNPFLRCTAPGIRASAKNGGARDDAPEAVFAAIRSLKDRF